LSSDHLLSGVIAEYYTMNSGSSGGIGKGNRGSASSFKDSRFKVSSFEYISELLILRLIHATQEQPHRPKRDAFLSGFPLCTPVPSVVQALDFRVFGTRKRKSFKVKTEPVERRFSKPETLKL
jgi:hypothetical protein